MTTTDIAIQKARYSTDIFTTEGEAKARSMDMGFDGVVHVSTYDGQAVYRSEQERHWVNQDT